MHKWLDTKWIQYLGKISYSFYLVHIVFGTRVINLGYRLSGDSPIAALVWFALAFVISISMAHLTYLLIEKPSIELSKNLKIKAA
ncbi:hypothetical protein NIES2098_03660 [Calothrix sp. NIES-2098]|nr:hypothetical protein NIES2098_03660 [Calothrix sp. NIES-2098]